MNALGYVPDQKIIDVLDKAKYTLSAEVIPPRNGAEQQKIFEQIKSLVDSGSQFIAVTKGAGGSLRGGSLPIAQAVKDSFKVPCVAHFTCRDLTIQEVENSLIDHHYFGIRNILALRGDPPFGQKDWTAKEGSYSYAYQLIEQIKKLNQGKYLPRQGGPEVEQMEKTDFCIGCAVYPEHPDPKERIEFLKKKVDAGAEYAITQMVFDADIYGRFLDLCEKEGINIPILPGTRLLKSKKTAAKMTEFFSVSVPKEMIDTLPEKATPETFDYCVEEFLKFNEKLKKLGAPGVHLFVLTDTRGASAVNRQLLKK